LLDSKASVGLFQLNRLNLYRAQEAEWGKTYPADSVIRPVIFYKIFAGIDRIHS